MENLNEFIGLMVLGSTYIYKKYLSAAARACKNSKDKKACINIYRIKGYEAQVQKLKDNINKCKETNDPKKCNSFLKSKIEKIQKKILKLIRGKKKMTVKELKLMAGDIIKESSYSNSAKKQLFNFVLNEASEPQLKALILDGKMIQSLQEDAIDIVNKRFDFAMDKANQDRIEEIKEFVEIGKEGLCKIIEKDCTDINKLEGMLDFIVNESSDYQVLSMMIEGNLPEETSNSVKEAYLYEQLMEIKKSDIIKEKINKLQSKIK